MRTLEPADLQAVFRFFAAQATNHYGKHKDLAPACVLVWLQESTEGIRALHQFPDQEVAGLLATEPGRVQLASAIQTMLNPQIESPDVPAGPRPHLAVQVLLAQATPPCAAGAGQVLMILVHAVDANYAVALPVHADSGAVDVPGSFDLAAAKL